MDETQIGTNIKKIRLDRHMSQENLAELSGLTKGYISKIEKSEDDLEDMIEKVRSGAKKFPIGSFSKLDICVGKILEAEPIAKSQTLIKLSIDVGSDTPKTAVAGIAKYYKPEEMKGRQVVVVTNLEPRR